MQNRRDFLKNASLIAMGGVVPEFLARTAQAATPGQETILVVVEMNGGNDGLNTVVPFADERYFKFRPTIGIKKAELNKVNDSIGLHPRLGGLSRMLERSSLAIIQGVGYPNPDRSHFESMDVWQLADPRRLAKSGWLARAAGSMGSGESGFVGMQVGAGKLPTALAGAGSGIISLGEPESFQLTLSGAKDRHQARRKLLEDLSAPGPDNDLAAFVQRRQLQTLKAADKISEALRPPEPAVANAQTVGARVNSFRFDGNEPLAIKLQLVASLIQKGLGTRIFYVSLDGFDTHYDQVEVQGKLLGQLGDAIAGFFETIGDDGKRVLLLTYSEFGRRVKENGSRGTDHGSASCLFVAGPGVKAGPVGSYPSLGDLDDGDLKFNLDFRRVYATILDGWLKVDSKGILGGAFEHVEMLTKK
jgi:uncharacterized protein (DUF1501 family)